MVSISYPRESTKSTDHYSDIGNHPHNKDGVMSDIGMPEVVDHLEKQPDYT